MDLTASKSRLEELYQQLLFDDSGSSFTYTKEMIFSHISNIKNHINDFFNITEDDTLRYESYKIAKNKKIKSYLSGMLFFILGGMGLFGFVTGTMQAIVFIVALLSGGLAVYFFMSSRKTFPINKEMEYIKDLTEMGWIVSTQQDSKLYKEWSDTYPFFKQGDVDDRITIRIYGNYEGYDFCYFEYAYTIEREVEEIQKDSDGNETKTTKIERDYYEKSGIFVNSLIDSSFKLKLDSFIDKLSLGKKPIKFSHLEFEKKFGLYADEKDISLQKLFSPKNRNALLEQSELFEVTNDYIQDDNILASFSDEEGFYKEGVTPIENFSQTEISSYIQKRLYEPLSLVKILKGEAL